MRRVVALLCCVLCLAVGCTPSSPAKVTRTDFALDTVISITIHETENGVDAQAVLDACFAEVERLEELLSATRTDSDIDRVNGSNGAAINVHPETVDVLKLGIRYGELTDGAFDITMRPVTQLWDFSAGVIPNEMELATAAALVDYQKLRVTDQTVTLTSGGVDLGGVAKGYIGDRLRDLLAESGVTSALIDLGGNIVACGSKAGEDWKIGIKDPDDPSSLCAVVTGQDISVVTSGIYERGFTADGVRYHHLLSSETGMPVQNELASVTVVCTDSADADALSTACFVLGETRARELVATLDGVDVLFVHRDGTITATDGLKYHEE